MKKITFILILLMTSISIGSLHASDHSQNHYVCNIFEPNAEKVEVHVNPSNREQVHYLQDGVHYLSVQWWNWTLNLGLMKKGQTVEVLGAASHTNLKLRSHTPDISVWCDKLNFY